MNDENELQFAISVNNDWAIDFDEQSLPSQKISNDYACQLNEDKLPIGFVSNSSYKYDRSLEPSKTSRQLQSYNPENDNKYDQASDYSRSDGIEYG